MLGMTPICTIAQQSLQADMQELQKKVVIAGKVLSYRLSQKESSIYEKKIL